MTMSHLDFLDPHQLQGTSLAVIRQRLEVEDFLKLYNEVAEQTGISNRQEHTNVLATIRYASLIQVFIKHLLLLTSIFFFRRFCNHVKVLSLDKD